jgi:hypothetical protein
LPSAKIVVGKLDAHVAQRMGHQGHFGHFGHRGFIHFNHKIHVRSHVLNGLKRVVQGLGEHLVGVRVHEQLNRPGYQRRCVRAGHAQFHRFAQQAGQFQQPNGGLRQRGVLAAAQRLVGHETAVVKIHNRLVGRCHPALAQHFPKLAFLRRKVFGERGRHVGDDRRVHEIGRHRRRVGLIGLYLEPKLRFAKVQDVVGRQRQCGVRAQALAVDIGAVGASQICQAQVATPRSVNAGMNAGGVLGNQPEFAGIIPPDVGGQVFQGHEQGITPRGGTFLEPGQAHSFSDSVARDNRGKCGATLSRGWGCLPRPGSGCKQPLVGRFYQITSRSGVALRLAGHDIPQEDDELFAGVARGSHAQCLAGGGV